MPFAALGATIRAGPAAVKGTAGSVTNAALQLSTRVVGPTGDRVPVPPSVAVVFGLMMSSVVAWLVSVHLVLRRVQQAHPDVYESMGRPHIVLNNTPQNTGPVLGFILGRRYRVLQDPTLDRLGDRARVVFIAASLSIGAMFVLLLIAMLTNSRP